MRSGRGQKRDFGNSIRFRKKAKRPKSEHAKRAFKKHAKSLEELGFNEYHLAGSGPTIMVPIKTRTIAKKVKFALWDRYSIPSTIIQTTSSNQKTYVI